MLPVITIVGRPNVGKSTLFNRLTRARNALVGPIPGLTRDRKYGEGEVDNKKFILIDTGGLDVSLTSFEKITQSKNISRLNLDAQMAQQAIRAISEAEIVFFVVDARAGLNPYDYSIAKLLRRLKKISFLVANKIDGLSTNEAISEFYDLGLGDIFPISAEHGEGTQNLIRHALETIAPKDELQLEEEEEGESTAPQKSAIKIAFIGRPNAGKSTLVNRILGEERVVVSDLAGTTRDSIFINFKRRNKDYILIDTAGVRKRARIAEKIEHFSVVKSLQAIEASDVVIMLMDAKENISDQDLWLLGFIVDAGKAMVIAINKWDNLPHEQQNLIKKEIDRRLSFVSFAKMHFISALHGTNVGNLFASINSAYASTTRELKTPELSSILEKAIAKHPPPAIHGRRIRLRYAHPGGSKPPLVIIHGSRVESIPKDYQRYLINFFREELRLSGTPIRIAFKTGINPYDDRK